MMVLREVRRHLGVHALCTYAPIWVHMGAYGQPSERERYESILSPTRNQLHHVDPQA